MPAQRPNILFFFTDDQRFDTIGALGNHEIKTPHLDKLAASGTAFTHAHIPGGTCGAVCMPSRAMLHSGRKLFHIDREGQEIPAAHMTLGECLGKAGYETFGAGKWHNGRAAHVRSFQAADEIFFGGMDDHWNVPAYHFDPQGRYDTRCPFVPDWPLSNSVHYRDCDHVTAGKHSTDLFADAAIRFLRGRKGGKPFFMYVSLMAPHDPRTMPRRFQDMYAAARVTLPDNFRPVHPIDTGALQIRDELLAASPRQPDEIRRHIAEYYAMISHLDDALGRLLQALRAAGELENTLVIFAADNGLALGRHGLMGKQNLYDHSVRVPLIFSGPGVPAGERRAAMVYLLDLFPTICSVAGVAVPDSVEGISMLPCFRDGRVRIRNTLYLAYASTIRGVRNERHKLIEYACHATQLFDLKEDRWEQHDLSGEARFQPVVAELRGELRRLRDEWDDLKHPAGKKFWEARPDLG